MKTFGSSQKQESSHVADSTPGVEFQFWMLRPSAREATGQRLHMFGVKSGQQFYRQADSHSEILGMWWDPPLIERFEKKKKAFSALVWEAFGTVGASIQAAAVEF